MEVEKGPEFNQTSNPKRQKLEEEEEDSDDQKWRKWMNDVKASREEVSNYLNKWNDLTFEQKKMKRAEIVMHDPVDYGYEGQRLQKILVDRAKKEDIQNEIKLLEELAAFCNDIYSAYVQANDDNYDSKVSACVRKLSKVENVYKKLNDDYASTSTSGRKSLIVTLFLELETLEKMSRIEEIKEELGDTGETYEDLLNRIEELMGLSDLSVVDPITEVPEVAMLIVFYLKEVLRRKEKVEKGNVYPRR